MNTAFCFYITIVYVIYTICLFNAGGHIFEEEDYNVTMVNGSKVILKCAIKANLNMSYFHNKHLNVSWNRRSRQILFRGVFRVTGITRFKMQQPELLNSKVFNLIIEPVILDDQGEYRCIFLYGRKVFMKRINLHILAAPKIVKHPSAIVKVDEDKPIYLNCEATGKPKPIVKWGLLPEYGSKNKILPLHYALSNVNTDIQVYDGKLNISNAHRNMRGTYRCEAANKVGRVKWDVRLLILYPPTVTMSNREISQEVGQDTVLKCTISAYPLGLLQWKLFPKNVTLRTVLCGILYDGSLKYCMNEVRNVKERGEVTLESHLNLFHINKEDFGTYVCSSENHFGYESGSTILSEKLPEKNDDISRFFNNGPYYERKIEDDVFKYQEPVKTTPAIKPAYKKYQQNDAWTPRKSSGRIHLNIDGIIQKSVIFLFLYCFANY